MSEEYRRLLAHVLRQPDPSAALEEAIAAAGGPLREALERSRGDGLRMSALLVARLRFERLTAGSAEANGMFEEEPAAFAARFRRYHAAVPPRATPPEEAAAFAAWLASDAPAALQD